MLISRTASPANREGTPCQVAANDPSRVPDECERPGDVLVLGGEEREILQVVIAPNAAFPPASVELRLASPPASLDGNGARIRRLDAAGMEVLSVPLDGATLKETLAFVKAGILPAMQPVGQTRRRKKTVSGKFIAKLVSHKVSDGETLESIAESYKTTADALAKFNWGTTDPEKIQSHLLIDVGCTKKDDGGKYVLSSEDEPGILYIPRPLDMDWVALEQRHIWRVKKLPDPRLYLFSA